MLTVPVRLGLDKLNVEYEESLKGLLFFFLFFSFFFGLLFVGVFFVVVDIPTVILYLLLDFLPQLSSKTKQNKTKTKQNKTQKNKKK